MRARVVQLVRRADPARAFARAAESLEVVVAPLLVRQLDAVVVHPARASPRARCRAPRAELVADALLEHVARVALAHAILDHVVQNAGDDGLLVLPVAREDDRDVRRMREVGSRVPLRTCRSWCFAANASA